VVTFDPATYRVLEQQAPGSRRESFLHIELEPLPDIVVREAMKGEIEATLTDVGRAVAGWRPMLERVQKAVQDWHDHAPKAPPPLIAEAMHFIGWRATRVRSAWCRCTTASSACSKTPMCCSCARARTTSR
jgi:glutamate dehydrogenase